MIGRVVHYRSRRILIFCGERSHDLHPVYGIVDTGAAVGEEAEARTYQSNKFHEAESAVALCASNEVHITSAAKLPDIESGLPLGQSADAAAYVNVYASVGGGILIDSSADAMKTSSVFSEAESGIATSEDIEAIKTSVAKLAESDEVIAVGGNSKGFATSHHNEAEAESGTSTLQNAEAYVEQPTPQYVIQAGKYISNIIPISPPLPTMDMIDADISFAKYGETHTYHGLAVIYIAAFNSCYLITADAEETTVFLGQQAMIASDPNELYMAITTDDNTFTVISDTEVTAEQYEIFNRYFQRVSNNNA